MDEKLKLTYEKLLNSVILSKDYDSHLIQIWESNLLLKLLFFDSESNNIRLFKPVQKVTLLHDLFTAFYSIVSAKSKNIEGLGLNLLNNLLESHVPFEGEIQLVDLNILKENWDNTIIKIQKYLEKKTRLNFDYRIPFLILFQELLSPSESFTFQGIELFFDTKTSKWVLFI